MRLKIKVKVLETVLMFKKRNKKKHNTTTTVTLDLISSTVCFSLRQFAGFIVNYRQTTLISKLGAHFIHEIPKPANNVQCGTVDRWMTVFTSASAAAAIAAVVFVAVVVIVSHNRRL